MESLKRIYNENRNGIIITLIFHIFVFAILNIKQLKIENKHKEPEIIIDFSINDLPKKPISEITNSLKEKEIGNSQQTNFASNKYNLAKKTEFSRNLQEDLENAKKLVNEVTKQLSKNIPTIANLKMPVETTKGISADSILKKLYNGDSNVEYILENRYHVLLPIPVYLAQKGGLVKVNILVDSDGYVVKAEPIVEGTSIDQLLSYAKTAALQTKFNSISFSKSMQSGVIKYTFIAQ